MSPQPNLNPFQLQAVKHLNGPMLVLAGAGSGKTRVVTYRTVNLIRHRIEPRRILAVTFTNKAAKEMQERITQLLDGGRKGRKNDLDRPVIGTFHSHCVQILRRNAKLLGYPDQFAIYDRSDQESLARSVLRELRVHQDMLGTSDLLAIIGRWKNAGVRPERALQFARNDQEHLAASGYRRYQKAIKLAGAMDFDDLLLNAEQLLGEHELVRQREASMFDHIMVDEYQDTNGSQYRIIEFLARDHRNLAVVGDDDQSIYGWRGAEVKHILGFKNDWPDAVIIRLEDNYRSSGAILEMANCLIRFNNKRHDKILRAARGHGLRPKILQCPSEEEEAKIIVSEIAGRLKRDQTLRPGDFAILFRTNEQPRLFEMALRRAEVPYVLVGSQSFFDRKEVRDIVAYLRIIAHPEDEISLLRIINTPARGLGSKSVAALLEIAVTQGKPLWNVFEQQEVVQKLPSAAKEGIRQLQQLVADFQLRLKNTPMAHCVQQLIAETRYYAEIERSYPDPDEREMRKSTVEEVINAVSMFQKESPKATLQDFLEEIVLGGREFEPSKEKKLDKEAVSLMTLHSAKGLEFPIVYMVGMEEGVLPHQRSLREDPMNVDEERRLCYVGITRAQEELTLSLPLTRFKWGKPRPTIPSRFLYEATNQADNPNYMLAIRGAVHEAHRSTRSHHPPAKKRTESTTASADRKRKRS